jgi:hypothetical protein
MSKRSRTLEAGQKSATEQEKRFIKAFKAFIPRYSPGRVFQDFCSLGAISIQNALRRYLPEKVFLANEAEYAAIAKNYPETKIATFAEMLACVAIALEENPAQDFLGEMFMRLELNNANSGQFFTPYSVSSFLARATLTNAKEMVERDGYITIYDPSAGAGCILIAAYNALAGMGINPQTEALFSGGDIDLSVLNMAYVQCSLLGMSAYFTHGDSLAGTVHKTLYTPMYAVHHARFQKNNTELPGQKENEAIANQVVNPETDRKMSNLDSENVPVSKNILVAASQEKLF